MWPADSKAPQDAVLGLRGEARKRARQGATPRHGEKPHTVEMAARHAWCGDALKHLIANRTVQVTQMTQDIISEIKSLASRGYGYEDIRVMLKLSRRDDEFIKAIVFKKQREGKAA